VYKIREQPLYKCAAWHKIARGHEKNHQYKITSAFCVKYKQETEYDHKTMKYMKANEDKNVNMVIRCLCVSCGLLKKLPETLYLTH